MITVQSILDYLEEFAPYSLAESWDNVGLLVGDRKWQVSRVLCSLDVTEHIIEEAVAIGAKLIVAHHPLIFTSMRTLTEDSAAERTVRAAIRKDIAVICMHTNADCAIGGVNDALAAALRLERIENMGAGESGALGRVGDLSVPMSPESFAEYVKHSLKAGGVRFVQGKTEIRRVAVAGGACGKLMDYAVSHGADAYVIGDSSYDIMQKAENIGLTVVDAGHFPTENPMTFVFAKQIKSKFEAIDTVVSKIHKDCILFR